MYLVPEEGRKSTCHCSFKTFRETETRVSPLTFKPLVDLPADGADGGGGLSWRPRCRVNDSMGERNTPFINDMI